MDKYMGLNTLTILDEKPMHWRNIGHERRALISFDTITRRNQIPFIHAGPFGWVWPKSTRRKDADINMRESRTSNIIRTSHLLSYSVSDGTSMQEGM